MKAELTLIPQCVVHPESIILYNEVNWYPCKPSKSKQNYNNVEKTETQTKFEKSSRKANGNVSKIAKRKISKAIEYLITTSSQKKVYERISGKTVIFKVAFVTLTLTSKQQHSDSDIINKCLNSFLLELKKFYELKNYIWRAEKQKNGNIHFHILIDKFVPYYELRNRWNRIINKLGYVDRYQENMKEYYKSGFKMSTNKKDTRPETLQYIAYKKASTTNFNCPNSTDIHSTKHIKNIKSYICKYLTKNKETPGTEAKKETETIIQTGRVWGCNHDLSKITGCKLIIDTEIYTELSKIVKDSHVRKYSTVYFTVYYLDYHLIKKLGADVLFKYFSDYLFQTFSFSEQLKIA